MPDIPRLVDAIAAADRPPFPLPFKLIFMNHFTKPGILVTVPLVAAIITGVKREQPNGTRR
jgi:hypothetical protein